MPSRPTGPAALEELTRLAQRQRLADPFGESAEAADLQWRSKSDPRDEPGTTLVWHDADGPVAAVFTTRSRLGVDLDVVCLEPRLVDECREAAAVQLADHPGVDVWTEDHHDDDWTAWALGRGFEPTGDVIVTTWRDTAPPPTAPLPSGYRLESSATTGGHPHQQPHDHPRQQPHQQPRDHPHQQPHVHPDHRPHHMVPRNGVHVAERLARCSLYRADLDLLVLTDDDEVAAYGLFWPDPVTRVGLVEPMRTEDTHQGLGLGRAVLTEGLRRLIAAGSTRLKVSYVAGNEPAERLYLGVGFVPTDRSRFLRRGPLG